MQALTHIGFLSLCTLLPGATAHAQLSPRLQQLRNTAFDHLTGEQGLPTDAAETVIEDSRGFIWLDTQNGLCRYDGYSMLVYRPDELDSTSISDNVVMNGRMLEDRGRKILRIAGRNGLNAYDSSRVWFTRFTADSANHYSLNNSCVNAMSQDSSGRVWIGAPHGIE